MAAKRNLLDLMTPEDRERALRAYEDRMAGGSAHRREPVSEIAFLIAEAGLYFGWGAVEAIKRGYVEARQHVTAKQPEGEIVQIPLTMEEVSELCRAARKIHYSDTLTAARSHRAAFQSSLNPALQNKKADELFRKGMRPIINKIEE